MVSHKNYHLIANEDVFVPLTSKWITYFIDNFTSGMKSKTIIYSLSESEHIYIYRILGLEIEVDSIHTSFVD